MQNKRTNQFLAGILLTLVLAGCADTAAPSTDTAAVTAADTNAVTEVTTEPRVMPSLPENLNFDGHTFTIINNDHSLPMWAQYGIGTDDLTGESLNDAIYYRNKTIEDTYNCKVVSKVNRKSLRELMSQTAIVDSVVSPAEVTAERIVVYVRAMKNADGLPAKTLHHLVSGQVDAMEFNVTETLPVIGVPLKDLPLKSGILLAAIVRQSGEIVIPSGNDSLQTGDDVIVVTTDTALDDLRDILR